MKHYGVRFVRGDGLETPEEDTVEIEEEEIVKQDFALIPEAKVTVKGER